MIKHKNHFDQTILLLQGCGALGSYHVGVYKCLLEFSYAPDWIIRHAIYSLSRYIPKNIKKTACCKTY